MASVNYFVSAKVRKLAPIYIRLSAGRGVDIIAKSGFSVDPRTWSNSTQTIKQRIKSESDEELITQLNGLYDYIISEIKLRSDGLTKEWLNEVVYKFNHHNRTEDALTLNDFIEKFISDASNGKVQGRAGRNIGKGTVRGLKGFQGVFNEYQGVYTDKKLKKLREEKVTPRKRIHIDFEDVTIDFYNSFKRFLSDQGYKLNTVGRFIKQLKYFMALSLAEKKHKNREFKESAFSGMSEEAFTVYLTPEEVENIYAYNLKGYPRMELARDKFIVLCETALRVSDYNKIDVNIRMSQGTPYIYLYQTKTADPVVIPLTRRMEEILDKYDGHLPRIPEQYVNEFIKIIGKWCGINEVLNWEETTGGLRCQRTALKYELISCHTGRRTAATNMYRAGIKALNIMRITGHRSEKTFLRYIRQTNEEVAEELAQHPYFTGNSLKVAN